MAPQIQPQEGDIRLVQGAWQFYTQGTWFFVDQDHPELAAAMRAYTSVSRDANGDQVLSNEQGQRITLTDLMAQVTAAPETGVKATVQAGQRSEQTPSVPPPAPPQTKPAWYNAQVERQFGSFENVGYDPQAKGEARVFDPVRFERDIAAIQKSAIRLGYIPDPEQEGTYPDEPSAKAAAPQGYQPVQRGNRWGFQPIGSAAAQGYATRDQAQAQAQPGQVVIQQPDGSFTIQAGQPQQTLDQAIDQAILSGDYAHADQLAQARDAVSGRRGFTPETALQFATQFAQDADEFDRFLRVLQGPYPFGQAGRGPFNARSDLQTEPFGAPATATNTAPGAFPVGPAGVPTPPSAAFAAAPSTPAGPNANVITTDEYGQPLRPEDYYTFDQQTGERKHYAGPFPTAGGQGTQAQRTADYIAKANQPAVASTGPFSTFQPVNPFGPQPGEQVSPFAAVAYDIMNNRRLRQRNMQQTGAIRTFR